MSERLGDAYMGNMTLKAIKEMGNELSRLRFYVAAVTPLVEAAEHLQKLRNERMAAFARHHPYHEEPIKATELYMQAKEHVVELAMKLEVPRG